MKIKENDSKNSLAISSLLNYFSSIFIFSLQWCDKICKVKILHVWLTCNAALFAYIFYKNCTAKEYYYLRDITGMGLSFSRASAKIIMFNSSLLTLETGGSHWSIYDLKACSTFFCFPPRDRWLQEIFDPTHFQSLLIMLQPMKTFRFVCSKSGITFIQTHVWTEHQPGFSFLLIGRNKTDTIDEVS